MSYGPGPEVAPGAQQNGMVIRVQSALKPGRSGALPIAARVGDTDVRLEVGDNTVPVPPGVWPLIVWCSYYGKKAGKAEMTVDTRAGGAVLVHYAPPHTIYSQGALGLQPVSRPGAGVHLLIVAGALMFAGLAVLLAYLAGR